MVETQTRGLWVAYGASGVVGMIRKDAGTYAVTMAGADHALGSYDTMEVAKSALYSQLKPGSEWPRFREH